MLFQQSEAILTSCAGICSAANRYCWHASSICLPSDSGAHMCDVGRSRPEPLCASPYRPPLKRLRWCIRASTEELVVAIVRSSGLLPLAR